jgi:hypothetical protein
MGCCEHGNEPLGYTKGMEFLDQLSEYSFLQKDLFHEVSVIISRIYGTFFFKHGRYLWKCNAVFKPSTNSYLKTTSFMSEIGRNEK